MAFILLTPHLSLAHLDINASVGVNEKYTDNLFLSSTDREYDFITTISPSISLSYAPNKILDLSLDYGLNFRYYSRHSELDDTSIGESQTIRFQNKYNPWSRLFLDISDVYERVPIDNRKKVAFENVFVDMTDRNIFSVSPYMKLPLTSTVSSTIGYEFTDVWYRAEETVDYDSHLAFFNLSKQFPFGFSTHLNYSSYAYRPKSTDSRYDRHQGSVGASYRVIKGVTVSGEVGKAKYDYKTREDEIHDFWNVGLSADRKIKLTGHISLTAGYGTSFSDPNTKGEVAKSERIDLGLLYETSGELEFNIKPYYITDGFITTDREDEIIGVTINFSKPLTRKVTPTIRSLWERHELLDENERRNNYSVSAGLDYRAGKRITTSVGYAYNYRNSNVDTNDFYNNVAWIQATLALI
jgi:hypothetical protein